MGKHELFKAAFENDVATLERAFLKDGFDPNMTNLNDGAGGSTLLNVACSEGNYESAEYLLCHGANPNLEFTRIDFGGRVFQKRAVALSNVENRKCAELLIAKGAIVNKVDGFGYTPIVWHALRLNSDIIDYLASCGADFKIKLDVKGGLKSPSEILDERIESLKKAHGKKISERQKEHIGDIEKIKRQLERYERE